MSGSNVEPEILRTVLFFKLSPQEDRHNWWNKAGESRVFSRLSLRYAALYYANW